jgi:hypothetical protein
MDLPATMANHVWIVGGLLAVARGLRRRWAIRGNRKCRGGCALVVARWWRGGRWAGEAAVACGEAEAV